MTFLKRIFGGANKGPEKGEPSPSEGSSLAAASAGPPPAVPLNEVMQQIGVRLMLLTPEELDLDLIGARLADAYRDMEVEPMEPAAWKALTSELDEEARARLSLLAAAVRDGHLKEALPGLLQGRDAATQVREGFIELARGSGLLTRELLQKSALRIEELARRWLALLGAEIAGETPEESRTFLERLDYGRLLAEADRAKLSAEERALYLKKLQDDFEKSRPRRGKW